jgi:hypothetical protein
MPGVLKKIINNFRGDDLNFPKFSLSQNCPYLNMFSHNYSKLVAPKLNVSIAVGAERF